MDQLEILRKNIDQIDNDILTLLVKRFSLVKKIGVYKKNNNMLIVNKNREEEKINALIKTGNMFNMSKEFIQNIWQTIFAESYKLEI
ncbi:MAG: chorismate mutase [Candidatus Levyibacteriota bacterium]|nr:MAG: chorismate mutase [Candidatus Levybacteria bacterium]